MAENKKLLKDVTNLIVDGESIIKAGGTLRTAPPNSQSSTKPPGGNLRKNEK